MTAADLPVEKLQRSPAPGIFCALSGSVRPKPGIHIHGNAGIERAVAAAQDIKAPDLFHDITAHSGQTECPEADPAGKM